MGREIERDCGVTFLRPQNPLPRAPTAPGGRRVMLDAEGGHGILGRAERPELATAD